MFYFHHDDKQRLQKVILMKNYWKKTLYWPSRRLQSLDMRPKILKKAQKWILRLIDIDNLHEAVLLNIQ